jgi:uncharacterized protein (DUF2342 family)
MKFARAPARASNNKIRSGVIGWQPPHRQCEVSTSIWHNATATGSKAMNEPQLDHQSMLKTLDQLSQTVDVMGSVISRLQHHVEQLMQQRAELVDNTQPASLSHLH